MLIFFLIFMHNELRSSVEDRNMWYLSFGEIISPNIFRSCLSLRRLNREFSGLRYISFVCAACNHNFATDDLSDYDVIRPIWGPNCLYGCTRTFWEISRDGCKGEKTEIAPCGCLD